MGIHRFNGLVLFFALLASTAFGMATDNGSNLGFRRIGNAPTQVVGVSPLGRLVIKSASSHIFLWEPGKTDLQILTPENANRPSFSFSPDGRNLLLQDAQPVQNAPYRLMVYDLDAPKVEGLLVPESRSTTSVPFFSPDGTSLTFFEQASPATQLGWSFPLTEYLSDVKNGVDQQTGFYLKDIPTKELTEVVNKGVYSPDGARLALLVAGNVNRGSSGFLPFGTGYTPFGYYIPDSEMSSATTGASKLTILDIETGKTSTLTLDQRAANVFWPSEDQLLVTGNPGFISRAVVAENKIERLTTEEASDVKISTDGTFAYYKPVRADSPNVRILMHLASREAYEIHGAMGGVFTGDSQTLVLSREKVSSGGPFVQINLQAFRERRAPRPIDIEKDPAHFPSFGEGLPVWEVPHGAKFADIIEFSKPELNKLDEFGWDMVVEIKNKSPYFMGFDLKDTFGLVCELVDNTGKVYSRWNADDADAKAQQNPRLSPQEKHKMDCGPVTEVALPVLFSGKIRFWLNGYEAESKQEITVQ